MQRFTQVAAMQHTTSWELQLASIHMAQNHQPGKSSSTAALQLKHYPSYSIKDHLNSSAYAIGWGQARWYNKKTAQKM